MNIEVDRLTGVIVRALWPSFDLDTVPDSSRVVPLPPGITLEQLGPVPDAQGWPVPFVWIDGAQTIDDLSLATRAAVDSVGAAAVHRTPQYYARREIKLEARRRIESQLAAWRQRNLTAYALRLVSETQTEIVEALSGAVSFEDLQARFGAHADAQAERAAELAGLSASQEAIVFAVRDASDAMELEVQALDDRAAARYAGALSSALAPFDPEAGGYTTGRTVDWPVF